MYQFSKRSTDRMKGVDPNLVMVFMEAIKISPMDFGIPQDGGVRTAERQRQLYDDPQVATKCDGYNNISRHQVQPGMAVGTALDFYAYINGRASWKENHMAMVATSLMITADRLKKEGKIPESFNLRWGASFGSDNWSGWDAAHMECNY